MLFASRQKLDQMTDTALDQRHGFYQMLKGIGEGLRWLWIGGGVLCGGAALAMNASKLAVAVAFGAGAAVPVVVGFATVIIATLAVSQVESVQQSRPRASAAKTKDPEVKPGAAPALANAPDLSDEFHAGVSENVTAMKPLKLKARPDQSRVM